MHLTSLTLLNLLTYSTKLIYPISESLKLTAAVKHLLKHRVKYELVENPASNATSMIDRFDSFNICAALFSRNERM